MKNFKKMLALVIAAVMIVGTMSMGTVFAETPEGLTADGTVTISGLDDKDTVNLYKVIQWNDGDADTMAGWVLTDDFKDDDACKAVLQAINEVTDGVYSLTEDDVKAFTDVINDGGVTKITGGTVENGKSVTTVDAGMYIALVKPAKTDTLYNPIIVSADYNSDNGTNIIGSSVPLSQTMVGDATATAKKETLKVEKTQDDTTDTSDNSYDVGDTVTFTVKTTIPTFADIYQNPTFTITDEMSDGLVLQDESITVKINGEDVTEVLSSKIDYIDDQKWSVDLTGTDYLKLEAPTPIEITYEAVLTESSFTSVNEETNDVKVEFSNNPDNQEDKGTVKDKTRTYTFSIDGSLLGGSGEQTSELVKVAVDGNGNPINQSTASGATYENALKGAVFGLYKSAADAEADTNRYTNEVFEGTVTTDGDGYMQINGLDVGTYYLKEISAPAGYIKDQKVHTIEIEATYGTETVTEKGYTYTLPVLESYTIKIDNTTTSTYSMKLEASAITTSEATNLPTSIQNTKGIELPSTGGMGTTLFYIIGAVLVLGAGILLVTRRRMSAN